MEEVNAWGSYDQTAKNARALSHRRRSKLVDAGHATLNNSYHAGLKLQYLEEQQADARLNRRASAPFIHSASDRGTDAWGGHFRRLSLSELPEDDAEEPTEKPGDKVKVSVHAARDIREIFGVYFEGTFEPHQKNALVRGLSGTMPWIQPYLEENAPCWPLFMLIEVCLRSLAQVYFQNNPVSGLLILVGLFVQSSRGAIHGLVAVLCGNLLAYGLGFDKGLIRSGLFGYNAVLVGLLLATFDTNEWNGWTFIASIVFSSFSSIIFVMMGKLLVPYKSPPLTLPFNVSTILFLLATANMGRVNYDSVREPALPDYTEAVTDTISGADFFKGVVRGIGQVYAADELASGFLIWAGIAVCSRIAAVAAIVGSGIGAATALVTGVSSSALSSGVFGFNSSLSFTAMFMFYTPNRGAAVMGFLAAFMTVIGQQALDTLLEPYGLPFLTLPFCFVALPFIILQGTTNIVIAVPLASMTTPEDHLKRVKILTDGFQFLKEAIHPESKHSHQFGRRVNRQLSHLSDAISNRTLTQDSSPKKKAKRCRRFFRRKQAVIKDPWIVERAPIIFDSINKGSGSSSNGELCMEDFRSALRGAGMTDTEGIHFASLVFNLMDLDKSGTIDKNEFVVFCLVSRALHGIRDKIAKFFDFVDVDHNLNIEFDEIDAALEYLGRPTLTEEDRATLACVSDDIKSSEKDGIDTIELINFVTVATIKALVDAYHNSERNENA